MSDEQQAAMDAAAAAQARQAAGGTAIADPPQPDSNEPAPQQSAPLAGKYQSPIDLIEGVNNAREQAGLPRYNDAVSKAMLDDIPAAEAEYRSLSTLARQQSPAQEPPAEPSPSTLTIDPASVEPGDLNQFLDSKGLKSEDLAQQYQSAGELTDEQYEKLGMPKALVNEFLAGQAARAQTEVANIQQTVDEAIQIAGGQDGFKTLSQWAAGSIPKDELGDPANPAPGTINHRIQDPKQVKSVVYELVARRSQATGSANSAPLIDTTASAATMSGGFTSMQEFLEASDKNVKTGGRDAALRKRIQATDISKLS